MLDFQLTEEQAALCAEARRFAEERIMAVAAQADRDAKLPLDIVKEAWELGLLNATVEEAHGGAGMSHLDHALITEQLAYGCSGIQTSLLANTLALTPIQLAGNPAQKEKYICCITS